MLEESSVFYDLIYGEKDYAGEALRVLAHLPPQARTLLDVGCGTGEHHRYLVDRLNIHGVDLNSTFLDIARAKNPTAEYSQADMRDFRTGRLYDVVTSLFSSIGYCQDLESMTSAVRCLTAHVAPGGLLLLEPWLTPDAWTAGRVFSELRKSDGLEVARMSHSSREGRLSLVDFHYLVGAPGKGIKAFHEQHRLALYTREEMAQAIEDSGMKVEYDEVGLTGRGLYIGHH